MIGHSAAVDGGVTRHVDPMPIAPPAPRQVGFAAGVALIVLGGLIAAVTGPLHLERGSWLAAYLVLVAGVAQCVMSTQNRLIGAPLTSRRRRWMLLLLWNGGNALIITASLASTVWVSAVGGFVLFAALALAVDGTRHPRRRGAAVLLRILYAALAVSVVIGVALTGRRVLG